MRKKAILGLIFTVSVFILLLIPSENISSSIASSVIFCGKTVIPQLFLYLCLSAMVWELGVVDRLLSAFPRYGAEISAFIMGILAGFPSGALIAGNLLDKKMITEKRAEYLMLFSNNAGLSFVFGFVATVVGKTGAFSLFICQLMSSFLFALLGRKALSAGDKEGSVYIYQRRGDPSAVINGIKNATQNMINICGFILFFSSFSTAFLSNAPLAVTGMTELTTGINSLFSLPFESRLIYCGLFLGFGGICVHFQIFSVCRIKMTKFLLSKCISALFCAVTVLPIHNLISRF